MKESPNRSARDALKVIYLVTLGGVAGLFIGGVLITLAELEQSAHALSVLLWSSTWLGVISWLCLRGQSLAENGVRLSSLSLALLGVLVGLIGMPLASVFAGAVREGLGLDPVNPQLAYILIDGASLWVTIGIGLCVVIIQPLIEEILYRGALYSGLRGAFGKWPAILGSSFLFGLMHGDPALVAGTTLLGVLFGMLREQSGSITPAYLAHAVNNGLAFAVVHLG